jgi:N-formylglutamate deformylase
MSSSFFSIKKGAGPVIAVANHYRHALRPEVARIMDLDEVTRLREEASFTGEWAGFAPTCLVTPYPRFEIDLNRPRENTVYLTADDVCGLQVWKQPTLFDVHLSSPCPAWKKH